MAHSGRPRKCDPKVSNLRNDIHDNNIVQIKSTSKEFGIDAGDGETRTALINAVIEEKHQLVEWLIQNGANINHQDRIGYSALHFIAQNNQLMMADHFLQKGANPNLTDIHGNPPLWTAVMNIKDDFSMIKLLLNNKANPDILNNYGRSPRSMYYTIYKANISDLILG